MIYGYARVSSKGQKLNRQIDSFLEYGIIKKNIFSDKISGKTFERKNYLRLVGKLKQGDLLIVASLDRLGRDYDMILSEWSRITKQIGADILVLDMPLLDTRVRGKDLTGRLIADIVLQLLSYVAHKERDDIKERQREGIESAKKQGIKFGRPAATLPHDFTQIAEACRVGELTLQKGAKSAGLPLTTFYRHYQSYSANLSAGVAL